MPPILVSIISGLVRTAVAAGLGYLAHKGVIAAPDSSVTTEIVTYVTGIVLVAGWSIWEKYGAHSKLAEAQAATAVAVSTIQASPAAICEAATAPPLSQPKP